MWREGANNAPALRQAQIGIARVENNIANRLAAVPGVTSVGFAKSSPGEGIEPAGI